jgi:hypothetical protein
MGTAHSCRRILSAYLCILKRPFGPPMVQNF